MRMPLNPGLGTKRPDIESEEPRYPRRDRRKPPKWYMAGAAKSAADIEISTSDEPTLREAMSSSPEEKILWQAAIDDELESLSKKNTCKADSNPQSTPLPTHVVLKIKRHGDGSVERFKAQVVAGGNYQTYGEDYLESYAPVVSFSLVHMFLYLTLCLKLHIAQLDILNGELNEDVWGHVSKRHPGCAGCVLQAPQSHLRT